MAEQHEYVVLGAGVVGLSVARELARRGRDVICLEQLRAGHDRAGSKSRSRILRAGYHDPFYVRLAMQTLRGWERLEHEAGSRLLVASGLVSCGERVDDLLQSMRRGGATGELVTAEEVGRRFPGLSVTSRAVYESTAGVLLADEVLRALVHGDTFQLREHHTVTRITDGGDAVTIEAVERPASSPALERAALLEALPGASDRQREREGAGERRTFKCRVAVLCGGASSSAIARLAGLRELADVLWASLQQVVYVRLPDSQAERLPAVVWYGSSGVSYGLPTPGEGTYKLGLHDPRVKVDPGRSSLGDNPSDLALLAGVTESLLPGAGAEPVASERCFYDNAPGQDFVLDRVGRIVIAAGTSGHGFKFGPLIGEALADLAEEKVPVIPLERFSARRAARRAP